MMHVFAYACMHGQGAAQRHQSFYVMSAWFFGRPSGMLPSAHTVKNLSHAIRNLWASYSILIQILESEWESSFFWFYRLQKFLLQPRGTQPIEGGAKNVEQTCSLKAKKVVGKIRVEGKVLML